MVIKKYITYYVQHNGENIQPYSAKNYHHRINWINKSDLVIQLN